jgi:hypothetical protein
MPPQIAALCHLVEIPPHRHRRFLIRLDHIDQPIDVFVGPIFGRAPALLFSEIPKLSQALAVLGIAQ